MKIIDFMAWRRLAAGLSIALILASVVSLGVKELSWGLDFTGGTLVEVEYADSADLTVIRQTLQSRGYEGAIVVSFGTDRDVLIRLPAGTSDEQGAALLGI